MRKPIIWANVCLCSLVLTACTGGDAGTIPSAPGGQGETTTSVALDGDLAGRDLTAASISGVDLAGRDLHGADLTAADLGAARLAGADLSGAVLEGANLNGADLAGANLSGAKLGGAGLLGANLEGADLGDVQWASTQCPDGSDSEANGGTCEGHL